MTNHYFFKRMTYLAIMVMFGLVIMATCGKGGAAYSQSKPVVDSLPKPYIFTIDRQTYYLMDSIWKVSLQTTGYELKAPEADKLRSSLMAIINFFNAQAQPQNQTQKDKPKK